MSRFRTILALFAVFTLLTGAGSCGTSDGAPPNPSKGPERSTPPPPLTPGIPVTPPTPVFGDVQFGSHSAVQTQGANGAIVVNQAQMTITQVDFVPKEDKGKQAKMIEWKGKVDVRPVVDGKKNSDPVVANFSVAAGRYQEGRVTMSKVIVEGQANKVSFHFEATDLAVKIKLKKEEITIQGGKTASISVVEAWDIGQAKCLQNGQIDSTTNGVASLTSDATSVANQNCHKELKTIIAGGEELAVDGTDEGTTIEENEVIDSTSEEELPGESTPKVDKMDLWWNTRLRGVVVSPYKADGTAMTKGDFEEILKAGANLVYLDTPCPLSASPDDEAGTTIANLVQWAGDAGLYAVIACRTGPGRSEADFAKASDGPVCTSKVTQDKWGEMLKDVAKEHGGKAHVLGLDLMVEPHCPKDSQWNDRAKEWTVSIRKGQTLPIVIESNGWANPLSFSTLEPTGDDRTIYSLHMFEPYEFTYQGIDPVRGTKTLAYPTPTEDKGFYTDFFGVTRSWNQDVLKEAMGPASEFYKLLDGKKMPAAPTFVEFGSNSAIPSSVAYMKDLMAIFEEYGWSYAAYSWTDDNFNYRKGENAGKFKKVFKEQFDKNSYFIKP